MKGAPAKLVTIQPCAFAAYTNLPEGFKPGPELTNYSDPPNLTFPFRTCIPVVDIDSGASEVTLRRFVAAADQTIVNPMIGQG